VSANGCSIIVTVARYWPGPYGGGIGSGHHEHGTAWRVSVPRAAAAKDPEPGERWRFSGQARDGRMLTTGAWPLEPSGRVLVEYLAANPRFARVADSERSRSRVPTEADHQFRAKPIAVPRKPITVSDEADHRFRLKPIGISTEF
jgi:hypothetical protein